MSSFLTHGRIMGGLVTTPDLAAALADYRDVLGFGLVSQGPLAPDLAAAWGCPASAGAAMAVLQPKSGADCFIRLVEQPVPPEFVPTTTFGWASYEITVEDVFGWPDRLAGSGFEIIGPPKEIPGLPYFVAMQVHGRGREMLYFNEVRANTPSSDLPRARSPMDHIFIVILAAKDRAASVDWYRGKLGLDLGDTYTIEYTMINKAFGLPAGATSSLSMVQKGRLPIFEIDDYPPQARQRPCAPGSLPPGNALVSLAVEGLDGLNLEWIAQPAVRPEAPYGGRRSATTRGPSGELLELIEIGTD
jgi:catechol 2,3-dioxygenase-like lactoylglutathione lyase family enzyme